MNEKNVPIKYTLNNGDTVSIVTAPTQTPKRDWLNIVVTSKARVKIKQALREETAKAVDFAKEMLQRRFKNRKIEMEEPILMRYIKKKGFKTVTDFYVEIAEERLDPNQVIDEYLEQLRRETETNDHTEVRSAEEYITTTEVEEISTNKDVLVIDKNLTGIEYKLAKCCNPIYGDEVFGFVSTQGIKIHRMDCPNAQEMFSRHQQGNGRHAPLPEHRLGRRDLPGKLHGYGARHDGVKHADQEDQCCEGGKDGRKVKLLKRVIRCKRNCIHSPIENMTDGINTLRYSDFFLAMYFDGGKSCLHRNHSHVLVYMYSGEMVIDEREKTTRLHKGDCAFIRKDFSVQMTKQAWNGEQFKAIFLMFTPKFLRGFYNRLDRDAIPKDAKRDEISLYKLPSNRPDIVSLFESMTPYFDSNIQPTEELLQLKMIEGIYVLLNTSKNLYASIFDFTDPWKIDILEFLESNYMNDISMEEIANYTGRSLSTFKRDFKKCSTLSPREWLIRRRLEAARELIRKGGRKVSDICSEVGFKNLSHFSKIYKETYGIPPTEDTQPGISLA